MEWLAIQFHCAINSNISVSTFSGITLFSFFYGNNEIFYGRLSPECNLKIFKKAETFFKKKHQVINLTEVFCNLSNNWCNQGLYTVYFSCSIV